MEKKYESLTIDIDELGVAFVGLNRPQVHNAFDSGLILELGRIFDELHENKDVRLAVLFGHGKSFCAGGDLNWMRGIKDFSRNDNIDDSRKLSVMYARIHAFRKPLIGVVHGAALGGGSGLAAVCDFVVAAEDAKFGFTETRIGILPAVISPYAIEKIGVSAARAYFISGMQFTAATAKDIHLVHHVAPKGELEAVRDQIIAEFLKAAPAASRNAKALVGRVAAVLPDIAASTDANIITIAEARVSEEGQEGMDALLSGRKAKWVV